MKLLTSILCLLLSTAIYADAGQLKLDFIQAKRGDVLAQFSVASAYEFGTDIKKDLKKSLSWYRKAASKSHAPSQFKIGYFYEFGIAVSRDIDIAMSWYKKAKVNGNKQASRRLVKISTTKQKSSPSLEQKRIKAQSVAKVKAQSIAKAKAQSVAKVKAQSIAKVKAQSIAKLKAQSIAKLKAQRIAKLKAQRIAKATAQRIAKAKAQRIAVSRSTAVKRPKRLALTIPSIQKIIFNNKWKNQHGTADYIPSDKTTCLSMGDDKFTCFSSEKSRTIEGIDIVYTTKSTITGFKSSGSFSVAYNYNGISVEDQQTTAADLYGLTTKIGWQQPTLNARCQITSRKKISCIQGNKKVKFYY